MDGFENRQDFYWESVKVLENECDGTEGWCSGDNTDGSVLENLPIVGEFMRETKEKPQYQIILPTISLLQ